METGRTLSEDLSHHCREYPVVLAYRRPPVQRLTGVVRTIREGPRAPALTDDEWQTLGLEETTASSRAVHAVSHAELVSTISSYYYTITIV
jgi:hypothetical protein